MKSKLEKFAKNEIAKKQLSKIVGGLEDQGKRIHAGCTCNPDGAGTCWIDIVH